VGWLPWQPVNFASEKLYLSSTLMCAQSGLDDALSSQGESVQTLQRAIYSGPFSARHGSTPKQMESMLSVLTLLTNVIMTWKANRTGEVRARMLDSSRDGGATSAAK
jgi:hypothetical protein